MSQTDQNCYWDISKECAAVDSEFNVKIQVLQRFTGCSNDNFLVRLEGQLYVLRRYQHREDLLMRDQPREIAILQYLQQHHCEIVTGSILDFKTFYLIEYIPGTLLGSDKELATEKNNVSIARSFRQLHSVAGYPGENDMSTLQTLMLANSGYFYIDRYTLYLATDYLLYQIEKAQRLYPELLFSCITHNDGHSGNIIFNKGLAYFIDFEYASFNYNFYDICCYFAEFTGIDVDFDDLATEYQRYVFYQAYFGKDVDCQVCDSILDLFYIFTWGLWSLWGAKAGYEGYALRRRCVFKRFFSRVLQVLSSFQ